MPTSRHHIARDLDARATHAGAINVPLELTYLRAGCDPDWERPYRDGRDITDEPALWTAYQRPANRLRGSRGRLPSPRADLPQPGGF